MATPQVTAEPQRSLPTAANGISVTPSGTAWANSAYAEMTASIGSAITITGISVNAAVVAEFEVDIARGVATSEVVVATAIGAFATLDGAGDHVVLFNIHIDNIASGQRIACRMRKNGTNTGAWTFKLIYYHTVASTVGVTANASLADPSAAAGVSLTPSGTAWANSSWGELSASLTDIVVLGLVVNPAGVVVTGGTEFEVDVGAGAATSEIVKGTTGAHWEGFIGMCDLLRFCIPIQISGTNRIACRLRKPGTDTSEWTVKLLYISAANFGTLDVQYTTKPQKIVPDGINIFGPLGSATAWANSAWSQQIFSTSTAIVLVSRTANPNATYPDYEVDVGKGAASSEVVVSSDADNRASVAGKSESLHFIPVDNIPASTRVALRHRDADSVANHIQFGFTFYEKPL